MAGKKPLAHILAVEDLIKGDTGEVGDRLNAEIVEAVQVAALKAYHLLGCRDMARMDYILDADNQAFLLEANPIPGFTETSLLPMAAEKVGVSFPQLCLNIAQAARQRKKGYLGTG